MSARRSSDPSVVKPLHNETEPLLASSKNNDETLHSLHSIMKSHGGKPQRAKTVSWTDAGGGTLVDIQIIPKDQEKTLSRTFSRRTSTHAKSGCITVSLCLCLLLIVLGTLILLDRLNPET